MAADAASDILQVAALVAGGRAWPSQDDRALVARGRASGQVAEPFKAFVLPMMDGLETLLGDPAAAMLDVGVGVGGLAVAFCRVFPRLRVVGLDVFPRALELARRTVHEAGLADRVELRLQDVAELEDQDAYCLAWVPAPFIPRPALDAGLSRVARALVPGGWVAVGHGKLGASGLQDALTRFRAVAFGGAAIDDGAAQEMLRRAGLERVATLPTPEGAPGLTVGRRPRSGQADRVDRAAVARSRPISARPSAARPSGRGTRRPRRGTDPDR